VVNSWGGSRQVTYRGSQVSVAWAAAPPLFARDFSIVAELSPASEKASGVILASGSWFGGWSFYLDEGRPVAFHAFSQRPEDQFRVMAILGPAPLQVEFRFKYDGGGIGKGGTMSILENGKLIAEGRIERTISIPAGLGETMDTGRDTGVPVARDEHGQAPFQGVIKEISIQVGRPDLLPF
jgi:hypothetical protein